MDDVSMNFFTSIDQHLEVLRGMLGEVTAETVTGVAAELADEHVVAAITEATAVVKAVEAIRTVMVGVAASRSGRGAGHSGLAQVRGHRSPVSLVQEITGTTKAAAVRQVRLGESLLGVQCGGDGGGDAGGPESEPDVPPAEPWHAPLDAAVLAGTLTVEQEDAIRRNLGTPPGDEDATVEAWRVAAEQLITESVARTVEELGQAARRVRDALDPEGAERRFLARFEARSFRMWTDADGLHHGRFTFDDAGYAWIRATIDAALRPRTGGPRFVDPDDQTDAEALVADPRSNDQLTYDLILDLLHAGTIADAKTVFGAKQPGIRVVRVIPAETAPADETSAAGYLEETGDPVPAAFLNQRLCDTGMIECTLDANGNPLYLGREARLYSAKQKIALAMRDGGCRIPGCDRPSHYCEAHHIDEYARGGKTDVDRGILLCAFHHLNLHHHGWRITRHGLGDFVLHRPGEPPVVLKPRIALRYTWAGIDPPPRFGVAA